MIVLSQISTSSGQSSFAEVGIDKVEQWFELRKVYGDHVFQRFFEVLSDSMVLIDWLREETHGTYEYDIIIHIYTY